MRQYFLNSVAIALVLMFMTSCGGDATPTDTNTTPEPTPEEPKEAVLEEIDPMEDKGVGPVTSITLAEAIDEALVAEGKEEYEAKCTACHKLDKKSIGPSPTGVLERRTPEWIMNMILNPDEMVLKNGNAKKLMMEFNGAPMANQNLTEDKARAILEYFRTLK